mgnify:CR=1 FL=1
MLVREQVERAGGELSLDNFFKSLDEGWQERRVSVREASGDEYEESKPGGWKGCRC